MIKKAVIPAAGLGLRFLPATKSMPKEMLPLIDKPVIQYVVEEAIKSGIKDVIIVTGRGKRAIEDYFDLSPELEAYLSERNEYSLLQEIENISSLADVHYVRQKEPRGLGDAILKAEKHIGDEPFVVLLGDDIIINAKPASQQLIDSYEIVNCSIVGVEEVPFDLVNKYGIVDSQKREDLFLIENIIEKPDKLKSPSNLAIIGRYILTPDIFNNIKEVEPDHNGEIQLTDALNLLLKKEKIFAQIIEGKRYDIGDKLNYIKAIIDFALERDDFNTELSRYLKKKMEKL